MSSLVKREEHNMAFLTCAMVEQQLRDEMAALTLPELKQFALDMGVDMDEVEEDRAALVEACVAVELYAFTH